MAESPDLEPEAPAQFSVMQLFGAVTFAALLIGVITVAYQASVAKRKLRVQIEQLEEKNLELEVSLRNEIGNGLRTTYAEKILFHVLGHPDEFSDVNKQLANYQQRKVGIAAHPLEADDNLTYVNIYGMRTTATELPFCHSFLVRENPFEVLDYVAGGQSRYPRQKDGHWVCGAGKNGEDRWYIVKGDRFLPWSEEASRP